MSSSKVFATSEWDDDVPQLAGTEILTKKNKIKAKIKYASDKITSDDDRMVGNSGKRKIEVKNDSTPNKKKKRHETESYVKFESPQINNTMSEDFSVVSATPDVGKNKKKKGKDKKTKTEMNGNHVEANNSIDRNHEVVKKCKKKKKNKEKTVPELIEVDKEKKGKNKLKKEKKRQANPDEPIEEVVSEPPKKTTIKPKKKSQSMLSHIEKMKKLLSNVSTESNQTETEENSDNRAILTSMNDEAMNRKSKPGQKSLRERMMERLKGARFRYINEQLYVKQSGDAHDVFKDDPEAFKAYHDGYRQQVNKWPMNPLDVIIKDILKTPKDRIIADLGCGDARLAKSVPHKVFSFDLVAVDSSVQACDMSRTPLSTGQADVIVFCLSLMATNLKDYLMEANRILKIGGLMKIAEVESRFEDIEQFLEDVKRYGFTLEKKDLDHNIFYFIDFKKDRDVKKRNKLPDIKLNPCLYKKR